jgi:hypothetical protein
VHAQAEKSVGQPCCEAYEPYPCRLSHHAHAPEWSTPVDQAQFAGLVLH